MSWAPTGDEHWSIDLRCADCEHRWNAVVDDERAARYGAELEADRAMIEGSLLLLHSAP